MNIDPIQPVNDAAIFNPLSKDYAISNAVQKQKEQMFSEIPARYTGNTTQTISPGRASHVMLQILSNYPVMVKMGLEKHLTVIDRISTIDGFNKLAAISAQGLVSTDLAGYSSVKLNNMVHSKLSRTVDHLHHYRVAKLRMLRAGLIHVGFMWITRLETTHAIRCMVPFYTITENGEKALEVLNYNAYYILHYKTQ